MYNIYYMLYVCISYVNTCIITNNITRTTKAKYNNINSNL